MAINTYYTDVLCNIFPHVLSTINIIKTPDKNAFVAVAYNNSKQQYFVYDSVSNQAYSINITTGEKISAQTIRLTRANKDDIKDLLALKLVCRDWNKAVDRVLGQGVDKIVLWYQTSLVSGLPRSDATTNLPNLPLVSTLPRRNATPNLPLVSTLPRRNETPDLKSGATYSGDLDLSTLDSELVPYVAGSDSDSDSDSN